MYKFVNYLQNYVRIKITGPRPQKFINICLRRRIAVWELTRVSDREFTLCMFAGDFAENARACARKARVRVKLIEKKGVKYSFRKIFIRKSLLAVSVIAAALFCLLSSMVWRIDIEGADAASRVRTEQILDDLGVKRGMFISNINAKVLSQELLTEQRNLSWVGVRKRGMTLTIELEKGTFYEEKQSDIIPDGEACSIAVSKDCLLHKVTVEEGTKLINEGETALAGDIVVSGEGGHAKAELMGIVWYKSEAEVKKNAEIMRPTGKTRTVDSLLIFGLKIESPSWKWLPWNWGKDNFDSYDSLYSESYSGGGKIPIGKGRLVMAETKLETIELSNEEAKIRAMTEAETMLDAAIADEASILSTSGKYAEKDGKLYYILEAEVLENVGIYVKAD